jgi:periplasmic protein TonB
MPVAEKDQPLPQVASDLQRGDAAGAFMLTRVSSTAVSGLLHAAAILLILLATKVAPPPSELSLRLAAFVPRDISAWLPSTPRPGGGGGTRSDSAASAGRLPRAASRQFTPPAAENLNPHPLLAMEPTIVAASDAILASVNLPQFGLPDGVPGPSSGGRGSGGGIGDGIGTGVGNRTGPGAGDGEGAGGVRGRPLRGAITAPVVQWMIEPEYSEDARKAKVQGTVVLAIEVDARGQVRIVEIRQSLGLGLDERAIEAVRRWKFRPGLRDGKPVATGAVVHVNFRLL